MDLDEEELLRTLISLTVFGAGVQAWDRTSLLLA